MSRTWSKAYQVQLGDVRFPVTPERIEWACSAQRQTVTLINGEEISLKPMLALTGVSFEVLLPHWRYPFARYPEGRFVEKGWYVERMREILQAGKPVLFQVVYPEGEPEQMQVTLESYTVKVDATNGLDVLLDIQLREYRDYQAKRLLVNEDGTAQVIPERAASEEQAVPSAEAPVSYTVAPGDTLWTICQRQYGDGAKCWEVAKKNGIVNPNLIYPGQVMILD